MKTIKTINETFNVSVEDIYRCLHKVEEAHSDYMSALDSLSYYVTNKYPQQGEELDNNLEQLKSDDESLLRIISDIKERLDTIGIGEDDDYIESFNNRKSEKANKMKSKSIFENINDYLKPRPNEAKLFEMIDDYSLDEHQLLKDMVLWLSDEEIGKFIEDIKNEYILDDDEFDESFSKNNEKTILNERKWEYNIPEEVATGLRQAIEDEEYDTVCAALQMAWEEIHNMMPDQFDEYELQEKVEELDLLDITDEDTEDNINYELNDFYDFCDAFNIWIPLK